MATTTSITTTYAGEFAGQYISAALLEGSTIASGGITVKPNIKLKEVIKKYLLMVSSRMQLVISQQLQR